MCCRYLLDREHLAEVLTRLGLRLPDDSLFRTRYNIPPGGPVETVRLRPHRQPGEPSEREHTSLHWGLIPSWARERKGFGATLANARAETITDKPVFRAAWRRAQRCVIPASGFFEWQKLGKARHPWLFRLTDGHPFCFAGLWEAWRDPLDRVEVGSCTLITTAPNELLARIHDRMPVILDGAGAEAWLDPDQSDPAAVLQPFPAERMTATPLIPRVNSTANDDEMCLTPAPIPVSSGPSGEQLGLGF